MSIESFPSFPSPEERQQLGRERAQEVKRAKKEGELRELGQEKGRKVYEASPEYIEKARQEMGESLEQQRKEKAESEAEVKKSQEVLESFSKDFNITPENLNQIEGFDKLSVGQKALVLRNLRELTLRDVKTGAVEKVDADSAKAGWMGRYLRNVFKPVFARKEQKEILKQIQAKGFDAHKDVLQALVKGMLETGPDVKVLESGDIQVQFLSGLENLTADERKKVDAFNELSNEIARMPGILDKKNKKYQKLREKYEAVRGEALNVLKEKLGEDGKALFKMAEIKRNIYTTRYLDLNPDAEEELKKIQSQSAWRYALKSEGLKPAFLWA